LLTSISEGREIILVIVLGVIIGPQYVKFGGIGLKLLIAIGDGQKNKQNQKGNMFRRQKKREPPPVLEWNQGLNAILILREVNDKCRAFIARYTGVEEIKVETRPSAGSIPAYEIMRSEDRILIEFTSPKPNPLDAGLTVTIGTQKSHILFLFPA